MSTDYTANDTTSLPPRPDADAEPSFWFRTRRTLIAASLLIVAIVVYTVSKYLTWPPHIQEFLLALTAAMAVHLVDRIWLFRDTEYSLRAVRSAIINNAIRQTQLLINRLGRNTDSALDRILGSIREGMSSLDAMHKSGVVQIYPNRAAAATDITADLLSTNTSKIRIIGISLNDFVLYKGPPQLGDAWSEIRKVLANHSRKLEVRLLFIDPTCVGAQLRSLGETRLHGYQAGRLADDVETTIQQLSHLEKDIDAVGKVSRMYRLPPILFLVLTDSAAYVQQYYFWSTRVRSAELPILKVQQQQHPILYSELEKHFEWIWDKAAISIKEYEVGFARGTDKGLKQSGLINIYKDSAEALNRIIYLLRHATKRVTVQGISLHSFFDRRGELFSEISRLLSECEVEVEFLFLDPECEQAVIRGYREFTFTPRGANIRLEDYVASRHKSSTLYGETTAAMSELEDMVKEIAATKQRDGKSWLPKMNAKIYNSAPHCFLLRVDGSIMVEQYHYGKLPGDRYGARVVLGKDLPLLEYVSDPEPIYEETGKLPYQLLTNHLDFVFERAKALPIEDWLRGVV